MFSKVIFAVLFATVSQAQAAEQVLLQCGGNGGALADVRVVEDIATGALKVVYNISGNVCGAEGVDPSDCEEDKKINVQLGFYKTNQSLRKDIVAATQNLESLTIIAANDTSSGGGVYDDAALIRLIGGNAAGTSALPAQAGFFAVNGSVYDIRCTQQK